MTNEVSGFEVVGVGATVAAGLAVLLLAIYGFMVLASGHV